MSKTTTPEVKEPQVTKLTIITGFTACEDGCVVNTYEPGEYETLPAVALEHGLAIKAFSEDSIKFAESALAVAKPQSEE